MDIHEWAKKRVIEITETVLFYVQEGIEVETALDMVRKETTLSNQYFSQVVNNVFSQLKQPV